MRMDSYMPYIVKLLNPIHTSSAFIMISFSVKCKLYGVKKNFIFIHTAILIPIPCPAQCKPYGVRKSHIVLVIQLVR